jgi:hypothetical protein
MGRRKKTDLEKNNTKQAKVDSFNTSVDKSDSLTVFTEQSVSLISQEVIDKFDILPVGKLGKLSGHYIIQFNEKTYEESLNEAYRWRDRNNNKVKKDEFHRDIILVDYYPQEFKGKSVLVSYNFVEKEKHNAEQSNN